MTVHVLLYTDFEQEMYGRHPTRFAGSTEKTPTSTSGHNSAKELKHHRSNGKSWEAFGDTNTGWELAHIMNSHLSIIWAKRFH